jgi:hypothetical protein
MLAELAGIGGGLASALGGGGNGLSSATATQRVDVTSGPFGRSQWSEFVPLIALAVLAIVWIRKG